FVERFGAESMSAFDGKLTSVVFDATGNKVSMEKSLEYVAFGGTLVFVGLVNDRVSIDDPLLHRREITLKASRNSAGAFPAIMRMVDARTINTTPWITHQMKLNSVPDRFASLTKDPELVKCIIDV